MCSSKGVSDGVGVEGREKGKGKRRRPRVKGWSGVDEYKDGYKDQDRVKGSEGISGKGKGGGSREGGREEEGLEESYAVGVVECCFGVSE